MTKISLSLDPEIILFYTRLAFSLGVSLEQVLSDALFQFAGEISLRALNQRETSS